MIEPNTIEAFLALRGASTRKVLSDPALRTSARTLVEIDARLAALVLRGEVPLSVIKLEMCGPLPHEEGGSVYYTTTEPVEADFLCCDLSYDIVGAPDQLARDPGIDLSLSIRGGFALPFMPLPSPTPIQEVARNVVAIHEGAAPRLRPFLTIFPQDILAVLRLTKPLPMQDAQVRMVFRGLTTGLERIYPLMQDARDWLAGLATDEHGYLIDPAPQDKAGAS